MQCTYHIIEVLATMKRKVVLKVVRIIRDIVVNVSNDEAFIVMNDITQQLCIFNDLG